MRTRIIVGDCRAVMAEMDAASVDAVVTDPPYELGFMGKGWDKAGVAFDPETWAACKRVLKPGGHLLAFGGTRRFHRMTVAIEEAGFEIKDCLSWLHGQGFPKHKSLLKPGWEPIVLARKRGAGLLNIDACRIESDVSTVRYDRADIGFNGGLKAAGVGYVTGSDKGRWPANVCLDEDAAALLDEQSGQRPGMKRAWLRRGATTGSGIGYGSGSTGQTALAGYGDTGGASRFFYVAKASRSERNAGLNGMPDRVVSAWGGDEDDLSEGKKSTLPRQNHHPTVKPIALMRWLVRLVTPPDGLVLDPFAGSGSTGVACAHEGFRFLGIEQDESYAEIARRRIAGNAPLFSQLEEITA